MAVPQRTCIGCRQVKAKKDLIRIVSSLDEGVISVDPYGKEKGRGAYICFNLNCMNKALQLENLSKALKLDLGSQKGLEKIEELRRNLQILIGS